MTEIRNLGRDLAVVLDLMARAQKSGYVGAGGVAMSEAASILNRWLAIDAARPLQLTTESVELEDSELGTTIGSQSRWVSGWWIDVPDAMPMSPGNQRGGGA